MKWYIPYTEHPGNTVNGHVWNPVNYGIYTISTGDRRISEPSTVFIYRVCFPTLFHCTWTSRPDVFHASNAATMVWPHGSQGAFDAQGLNGTIMAHPWKLTWNLKITKLKRTMIFHTSIVAFYVNLPGVYKQVSLNACESWTGKKGIYKGYWHTQELQDFSIDFLSNRIATSNFHGNPSC